ncbi:MAG: nitroreductase [Candidatus Omnitrophica bacterium]|nr:nitroreductase [Candidatus Omnitrophota bacterium]MCM8832278.1 nitroreductase [Candidatus Omnitrophota bacterium]
MDILTLIKTRRSIRKFKKESVLSKIIKNILEAGRWAPSGLNNQPWRFMVLEGELKDKVASYTKYSYIIKSADKIILVFLDKACSYNYEKDLLAIGACIQNMLLYIHSIGLGACWLGEILNRRDEIKKLLCLKENLELEAVLAIGKPAIYPRKTSRKKVEELMIKDYTEL